MHGQVLVIDPIATQRIVQRVKLAAGQYDVTQASSINEGIACVRRQQPDLILCAIDQPDGPAPRLLARLRKFGLMGKIPVIAVGAALDPEARANLLRAGFDEVMSRPLEDGILLARTRSLVRDYASASEWQLREGTSRALGFAEPTAQFGPRARLRIVTAAPARQAAWQSHLSEQLSASVSSCLPAQAVAQEADGAPPDGFLLVTDPGSEKGTLGLLAALRSHAATRHCVILVAQQDAPTPLAAQMLDLGANDLAPFGASLDELAIRMRKLLARKMMADALRATVRDGIEAAVIDPLTGLHNRRYAMPHMARIAETAMQKGKPFAIMLGDMDHFKRINDEYGHAAGDAVLVEVAKRLRDNLRAVDLVARIGGEEFLAVLPGIGLEDAKRAARRLCHKVGRPPISIPGQDRAISATLSIGMVVCDAENGLPRGRDMSAEALLDAADRALYDAKAEGRNRVMLSRPAA